MTRIVLSILGMILSLSMLKYREKLGDLIGEGEWMKKIGGIYNLIIILSIFFFLWCVAWLTGTTDVLFSPVKNIIPGLNVPVQSF